jgi:hypothetical protein
MTATTTEAASFPPLSIFWATQWADMTGWAVRIDDTADRGEAIFLAPANGDPRMPTCRATVLPTGWILIEQQSPVFGSGFPFTTTTTVGAFRTLEGGLMALSPLTSEEVSRATAAVEGLSAAVS